MRLGLSRLALSGGAGKPVRGPVWTVDPTITGLTEIGATLASATGTATGTGVVSYARQWLRDGAVIPGATASTYVTDTAGRHSCQVTATDDNGSTPKNSNEIITLTSEAVWLWNDGTPIVWNDDTTTLDTEA